jgi:hypothetical protein
MSVLVDRTAAGEPAFQLEIDAVNGGVILVLLDAECRFISSEASKPAQRPPIVPSPWNWFALMLDRGEADPKSLEVALRLTKAPENVIEFLLSRLPPKRSRRGRPDEADPFDRQARTFIMHMETVALQLGKGMPRKKACEILAERYGLAPGYVDKIVPKTGERPQFARIRVV